MYFFFVYKQQLNYVQFIQFINIRYTNFEIKDALFIPIPDFRSDSNIWNMHLVYPWYNMQQLKTSLIYLTALIYFRNISDTC